MAFNARIGKAVLELSIDGGSFVRGAADAKATMRDLSRGIAQVQRDIGKQAFSFSGRAQIADAAKMAEAVGRVGGVTRLVASDQAKVNATLRQAIEYYKVLGKEAPKAWTDIEKATRKVATGAKDATSGFLGLTGGIASASAALGGFFTVGTIVSALKGALAYGDAIEKAGIAVGGTATQVQRLENIAVNSNTTLDALVRSLTTLQDRVAGEDPAAMSALKELRLDAQALMALSPDEQLISIANAFQRIASHSRQITLAKDLFGPGAVETFGALNREAAKFADSVTKLSDQQIQRLADMENRWDRLTTAIGRNSKALLLAYFFPGKAAPSTPPITRDEMEGFLRQRSTPDAPLPPDYVAQLKAAQVALAGLSAEQRKQLTAAHQLGDVTEKELVATLTRFGVKGDNAKNVLKLLNDQLGKSKKTAADAGKEWQNFIDRFTGAATMETAMDLGKAIGTKQIELARLTKEQQEAITKALEEGAEAWKAWGGVVPAQVDRAIEAVKKYKHSVLTVQNDLQPPAGPTLEDMQKGLEEFEAPGRIQEGAARDHAKALRDIDIQRTEAAIAQAEREGVKKAQILVMESILAQKKRDAEIADADAAYEQEVAQLQKSSATYQDELDRRTQAHQDHVDQINEAWAQGEAERREMIRRESSFWATELGKRISGELRGIREDLTGHIFSTLFAGADAESKKRAKEAREDYERIAHSGKSSAEEITRAFRAMRQAEEAAQSKWSDRFKGMWDSIKRHIFKIFDDILESFVNGFLKGMVKSFMGTGLGQKLGGWFGSLFGGGGSGGGFELPGTGGSVGGYAPRLLGKIPGVSKVLGKIPGVSSILGLSTGIATTAFSTATAGTLGASMIAPSVAMNAVPAAIASQGVSAGIAGAGAAGSASATGGAAAASGTAGALSGVLSKALPIAGALVGGIGLLKNRGLGTNLMNGVTAGASIGTLILPGIGTAIGAGVGALVGLFRGAFTKGGFVNNLFGGPDKKELAGRTAREQFTAPLVAKLTKAQLKEVAEGVALGHDEKWMRMAVAVRDTFVKAGGTAEKGFAAFNELLKAEKRGPEEVKRIEADIRAGRPVDEAPHERRHFGHRGTFHAGGIVGAVFGGAAAATSPFGGKLKPGEVFAKLLKGEAVLTPEATNAIGGKPIIDYINAGNGQAIKDALGRHEINIGDVMGAMRANRASNVDPSTSSFSAMANRVMSAHEQRIQTHVAALRARPDGGVLAAPMIASRRDSEGRTYIDNRQFHFSPKGVLDRGSVREIWTKDIVPMAKQEMKTNEGGLASAVRDTALK